VRNWLKKILEPSKVQFKDEISLDEVMQAFDSPAVRRIWMESLISKIQAMNMELDNLLAKEDRQRVWETLAIERRTILRCITMILDAKNTIESEQEAQERQNRLFKIYEGAAAPLNLETRQADNP